MASVRNELMRIYRDSGDELTPEAVVEAAEPEDSPLHNRFEWDDSEAGRLYRLNQARELIRSVDLTFARNKSGPKTVRAFVSEFEISKSSPGVYRATEDVVEDEVSYAMLLRNFERELADLKRKYGHLREFGKRLRAAVA
jgi:hypothetical protein